MSDIIDKFLTGSLSGSQIHFSNHFNKRTNQRELNDSYIKNLILNEDYLDFYEADGKYKYKLIYPSENTGYNLTVVILAKNDHILVMTVYESKIK